MCSEKHHHVSFKQWAYILYENIGFASHETVNHKEVQKASIIALLCFMKKQTKSNKGTTLVASCALIAPTVSVLKTGNRKFRIPGYSSTWEGHAVGFSKHTMTQFCHASDYLTDLVVKNLPLICLIHFLALWLDDWLWLLKASATQFSFELVLVNKPWHYSPPIMCQLIFNRI